MPSSGTLSGTVDPDHTATQAVCVFGEGITNKYAKVVKYVQNWGAQASYAVVEIPTSTGADHNAPEVSGTDALTGIRIGTPARCHAIYGGKSTTFLSGNVREINHDLKRDVLVVEVVDSIWRLEGFRIRGSHWVDNSGSPVYRQGWKSHVNRGGAPNAIWAAVGDRKLPFFCVPWTGVAIDVGPESVDPNSESTTQACLWTPWMLSLYINYCYEQQSDAQNVQLTWETDWAKIMDDGGGAMSRAAKEQVLDGISITVLMENILREAGDYTYALKPETIDNGDGSAEYTNQVIARRARYSSQVGGITMNRATSGNASTEFVDPKIITEGSLRESGKNLSTLFSIAGQLILIERRVDSNSSMGLLEAWGTTEKDGWQTLANSTSVAAANREYKNVFAAYRLDPDFDFTASTSESTQVRARVPRMILPNLLTSFIEDSAGSTTSDKMRFRRPVLVEYYTGTAWVVANYLDDMTIDGDGTIWLHGLREAAQTYSKSGSTYTSRKLRMTLAIPCDRRLTATAGIGQGTDTLKGTDDHDRIDEDLVLEYRADATESYGKEIRYDSYPRPQSAGGSAATNKNLRDDETALKAHLETRKRDRGRLDRGGTLVIPHAAFMFAVGVSIKALVNSSGAEYPIRAVCSSLTIELGKNKQTTYVEMT